MSGAGKSTLVRCINMLERPTEGEVIVNGQRLDTMTPAQLRAARREITMIFQRFNLLMQRNCLANVCFPMELSGLRGEKKWREQRALELLDIVGLKDKAKAYPAQLSGGQQQRVAFARAIVIRPSCTLFDEPLSALDALLREQMRQELKDLVASLGLTAVFVTHDQAEAMSMSSHIAVLNAGTVEQYDTPEGIYHRPATRFVARFVGKSNWLSETELFRPEAASLEEKPGFRRFELPVTGEEYLGESYNVQLQYQDSTWTVHTRHKMPIGEPLSVYIDPTQIIVCKKEKAES